MKKKENEMGFKELFSQYRYPNGKKRQLFSIGEHLLAILITALICFLTSYCSLSDSQDLVHTIGSLLFSASATILGIVIAGFAVFAAVSDRHFSVFLLENNVWLGISFPFWIASIMWGSCLLISGIAIIVGYLNVPKLVYPITIGICAWWFTLSLEFTVSLFGIILRTTYYRSKFYYGLDKGNNTTQES